MNYFNPHLYREQIKWFQIPLQTWVSGWTTVITPLPPSLLQGTLVFPTRKAERTKSSWGCQADVPFLPTARLRLLSGVHLADGDTSWWPYPCTLCFIPSHVLGCVSCLRVCCLRGLGPFLRCSCGGIGSWWDFPANKACPEHLGRVSVERTAWVGVSSLWIKALGSKIVVFLPGFARHSCCHPVLCCTCFRQPLLSSANAERLRGFFGVFLG